MNTHTVLIAAAMFLNCAPAAADPGLLAQEKGCTACHSVEAKIVGPAYKDVAAKYRGEAGAFDLLVEKVRNGGSGTWGEIPMPPNPEANVSDAEIKTLVEWVLSQ